MSRVLLACLALCAGAGLHVSARADAVSPVPSGLTQTPPSNPELQGVGIDEHLNQQIPLDLTFNDEQGKPVKLESYFHHDKPVLLTLVYFQCPMTCGLLLNSVTEGMQFIKLQPGKDYDVLTVSFNPDETPELAMNKKLAYLKQLGIPNAASGWHFLTGTQPNIAALASAVGFRYSWDKELRQYMHATAFFILTPEGRLSRYIYKWSPVDTQTLRYSLIDASQGKIGSPMDQVILYCFHYDPATGTYVKNAVAFMKLGGVITLLFLGGILGSLWFFEFRHRKHRKTPKPNVPAAPLAGANE